MGLKIGITCYPTIGGSGVVATELGKLLAQKGHEIHFITSSMPFRLDKPLRNVFFHEVEVNQYAVFRYPPYDLTLASKMAEVALREKLDILHVHYAMPHAVCAFLAKEMAGGAFKIVTTLHGTDITVLGDDPSLSEIIRFGIEKSDAVTAVSKDLVHQTRDMLHTNKEIVPIYNFVDEETYVRRDIPDLKKELGIEENEKVLIHISNFRRVKRVPDIIQTFKNVHDQLPSKLLLIGEGPEFPIVRDIVRDLGIEEHVLCLGKKENVADLLSISDLVLLLSEKESFGLILLEAAACSVPAIGTRIGGIPEVIVDGETGFIVPCGDIKAASSRALEVLQNLGLHEKMASQAFKRARTTFGTEHILSQYESVYYQVLGKNNH
ncbi:N-acetyl-alpha-D-glucosaminyl L-malate synthase BshA [Terrilactibacillus laevilacticus]|uniref:N-acetyl-alpha-D-glucosaminyl L-malate synthase BshA n=1 Tax=Terrilactibacillus laevilacticus TaxID=1380157 RepID=A0ABW5PP42_9BACI|nr:N-acetyl-alpha-D-glucosaminyl L-malate synthase BshA [Terrilactibacillus laevilacticus]